MRHSKLLSAAAAVLMMAVFIACLVNTGAVATEAASAAITIDGNTDDWKDITNNLDEPQARYDRIAAFCDDSYFYCLFSANDISDWCYYEVFIDTDCNLETGFDGFEFMQENGNLYISEGGEWPDTEIEDGCESAISDDGQTVEMRIALSLIKPTGKDIDFKVVLLNDNWEWVHVYSGSGDSDKAQYIDKVLIVSNQKYITDIKLDHKELKALTKATIQGGTVGTFKAKGGDEKNYSYSLVASAKNGPDNSHFKIVNNKLVTVDKLLAPGSYKIYVKVKSGVRSELQQITVNVGAPDASSITEEYFVGELGDWFTVAHNTASVKADEENSYTLNATRSQEKLYMMLASDKKDLNTQTIFTISTGKAGFDYLGLGKADYVVRDGGLYRVTAADSAAELIKAVDTTFDRGFTSARVLLSDIGSPKNITVRAFALDKTVSVPAKKGMKVTKSFSMYLDKAYYYPEESFEFTANPYKGFAGDPENAQTAAYPFMIVEAEDDTVTDLEGNALPKKCKGGCPEDASDIIGLVNHVAIMDTIDYVKENRLSWFGLCSPADLSDGDMQAYFFEGNIDYLQRILGYNLSVKRITKLASAKAGKTVKLTAEFRNKGVAALAKSEAFAVVLLNGKGKVVASAQAGDASKVKAGKTAAVEFSLKLPKNLKKGSYTLAIAVVDKETGKPVIALSNANTDAALYTELYTFKVK